MSEGGGIVSEGGWNGVRRCVEGDGIVSAGGWNSVRRCVE